MDDRNTTISGYTLREVTTHLAFKTTEGVDKEWSKLVLTNDRGDQFICSVDLETGDEIVKKDEKEWLGKKVILRGTLYRFGGLLKFKAMDVEIVKN